MTVNCQPDILLLYGYKYSTKIQEYLIVHKQVTPKQLAEYLGISRQALFKHLPKLLEEGKIGKIGKPPVVYYFIKDQTVSEIKSLENQQKSQIIEKLSNNYSNGRKVNRNERIQILV